jgi:hypothetical protein
MASLLDSLTELVTPGGMSRAATTLGESDASVSRAMRAGLSSVPAGLVNKTGDSSAMSRVHELATRRDYDSSRVGDLGSAVTRTMTGGAAAGGVADTLLSTVFGGRSNEVGNLVAGTAPSAAPSNGRATPSGAHSRVAWCSTSRRTGSNRNSLDSSRTRGAP